MTLYPFARSAFVSTALCVAACGGSSQLIDGNPANPGGGGDSTSRGDNNTGAGGAVGNSSDGGAAPGGQHDGGSTADAGPLAPFPKANACQVIRSEATLTSRPVDIIMVIDNSGSMTSEIEAVQRNVNVNFAQIIEASGLDFRVILISRHGSAAASQSVCITAPLSGTSCNPIPAAPVLGQRFFQYDTEIRSHNALSMLLSTYGAADRNGFAPQGWRQWLRLNSVKTFIVITDDESDISAQAFDSQLLALGGADLFGTSAKRNYTFHSIIGIKARSPAATPWYATDPKQNSKCSTAANPGARYEDLSLLTGGLRFPVCETASYDSVFRAAAHGVISGAKVSCEFAPPALPAGQGYSDGYIEYVPGGGGPVQFLRKVASPDACGSQGYFQDGTNGKITICPDSCRAIEADPGAAVSVVLACESTFT